MNANVVVVGSLNMDLVARAERLPKGGETVHGESFAMFPGGKGANQAVAAARLGATVAMVGCVGHDAYGAELRNALLAEGIDCAGVTAVEGKSSGLALIVVGADSQNAIVIIAGANGELTPEGVDSFASLLAGGEVVVCQLETPYATVGHVLARAKALGKTVILNPAPATGPLPGEWLANIDYLIPNESEAEALSGLPVSSRESAAVAAAALLQAGVGRVIVTLGGDGALFCDANGSQHFPATRVAAVDTTAAGDTFVGAFAAALANGSSAAEAIRFGQRAAAVSVTREGAQPSIPYLAEFENTP